jgi:hypothetical protein
VTRKEIKAAADTARKEAMDAYEAWNNACRVYNSWASRENRDKMLEAEVVYNYSCNRRERWEYNEVAIQRGWVLK